MARRRWNIETIKQVVDGEQPFIQVGYTGKEGNPAHKEGEVWDDVKGIKWTMKNGAQFRVNSQADLIRDLVKKKCSNCGFNVSNWGSKLDDKIYAKTGLCLDCFQAKELELKINGTYDKFVETTILKNKISTAKEFKKNIEESILFLKTDNSKIEMVHANGSMTTFVGSQNEKMLKEVEVDLEKVNKLLEELTTELEKTK